MNDDNALATGDTVLTEGGDHKGERRLDHFKVTVSYNGVPKKFEVRLEELVKKLLDQALNAFGPINNSHLLGLFTEGENGTELNDNQTIEAAGVKPGEELLLRPSAVRGG